MPKPKRIPSDDDSFKRRKRDDVAEDDPAGRGGNRGGFGPKKRKYKNTDDESYEPDVVEEEEEESAQSDFDPVETLSSRIVDDMRGKRYKSASNMRAGYLEEQEALLSAAKANQQAIPSSGNKAAPKAETPPAKKTGKRDAEGYTVSGRWAKDLSPDQQRKEQLETRDKSGDTPATPLKGERKVPKPGETDLTDTGTGGNAPHSNSFYPTSDEPLPSENLNIVGALTGAKAGMMASEPGAPKTAYQQRQEEKSALQSEYDTLFNEYSTLINTINWGKIGKDYTAEDVERLNEMEIQLGEMKTQLGEYDKNVEWEGRQSLVDERNALWNKKNNYGSFMYSGLTPEEEKRLEELEGLIAQGDAAAGNPEQFYSGVERVEGAVFGGAVEGAANIINAAGTLANAAGYIGEHYGDPRADAGYATDELAASFLADATEEEKAAWAAEMQQASDFGAKIEEFADSISDSAANDLAKAKAGLGELGQAGIDVLNNMVGMGMDAALSPLTGGSTLAAMFVRTFGGATAEARKNGADPLEQLGYGVTDAAIEVLTEKMGDGLAGFYGAGASDELANSIINRLTDSTTGRALLNILYSSYEEGAEEVVSDLLHPLAERIYNDQAIKDLLENGYDLDQLIYDYLIGATIGTVGGVSSSVTGEGGAIGVDSTEALASAANAEQARPSIKQAPGMEMTPETDGGEGKPFIPAETLAEAATPTTEGERKASGEDRAEEEAPKEPKTPDEILAEASQPKADEERKTTGEERAEGKAPEAQKEEAKEEQAPEEHTPAEEEAESEEPSDETLEEEQPKRPKEQPEEDSKEKGPDEVLAESATPKTEEERKTTGEEKAEGQSPEAPKTPAEKRNRASELRNQASKLWDEIEAAENSHANEDPDAAAYYEGLGEEAERLEAEAESLEKEAEEDELWGASEPVSPASTLAEAATPKGKAAEAPSEAAESKKGSDHESVPPSTRESTAQGEVELNSDNVAGEAVQRKKARIEAAEADTIAEADRLSTEFEQDPVNVQRFQDGQGTYSQYSVQERLAVLQHLFPKADYYISEGNIVKGRTFDTTTGQSETFGDTRTGSNHRRPKAKPAQELGFKGPGQAQAEGSFDPASVKVGDKLTHNRWGNVTVTDVGDGRVTVELPDGELKTVKQDSMGEYFAPVQDKALGDIIDENGSAGGKNNENENGQGHSGNDSSKQGGSEGARYDLGEGFGGYPRQDRIETNRRLHEERKQEIIDDGGTILNDEDVPLELRNVVQKYRGLLPDLNFTFFSNQNDKRPAFYRRSESSTFNGGIFINIAAMEDFAQRYGISLDEAIGHEVGHHFLFSAGLGNGEWFSIFQGNVSPEHISLIEAVKKAAAVFQRSNPGMTYEEALDEVACEAIGNTNRLYRKGSGTPDAQNILRSYIFDMLNEELPFSTTGFNEKRGDPGANKSWADSLMAQEAPTENQDVERADDDMTPLNDISREQDEERRKKQKAETKKHFGTENHERLTGALEKFESWVKAYDEKFGKTVETDSDVFLEEGEEPAKTSPMDEFVKQFRAVLDGEQTVQSFQEYYENLRAKEGDNKATDENWLYDPYIAEAVNELANAERNLIFAENGTPAEQVNSGSADWVPPPSKEVAKETWDTKAEKAALTIEARLNNMTEAFDTKVKANGEIKGTFDGKEGSGLRAHFENLLKKGKLTQMRGDTFFQWLGGFSRKSGGTMYELGDNLVRSTATKNSVDNGARQFFRDIAQNRKSRKAVTDFESGKTKGTVDIPGVGVVSLAYELSIYKTLQTNGGIEHMATTDTTFVNESDYRKGYNNNGQGETESYEVKLTQDALNDMAKANLQKRNAAINRKSIYIEKCNILKGLRDSLRADIARDSTARAMLEASKKSMVYMANETNPVAQRVFGVARFLQGEDYWPLKTKGKGNNAQYVNNSAINNMEGMSILQHRTGSSGGLIILPFSETMNDYINKATRFVAFGELNSQLQLMNKEMEVGKNKEKMSLQSAINKYAGKSAGDWMQRFMATLNGTAKKNSSSFGAKMRGALAQSSLLLNPGVAIKQTASFYNAMGILDPDIMLKNRLLKGGVLRTAKSYTNDPLIQALNERTGILERRKAGANSVEIGEMTQEGRTLAGKVKKILPNWMTNWINTQDYRTIANLAVACADQVERNNPGIDRNSDEFLDKMARLIEEVTIRTQPMYDSEIRPDYLRSDSELVRMMSMFRTQQSQNANNMLQAYGELAAAKREGGDVKAARKKAVQVTSGYAASQVAFAILSMAGKLLLHKQKDYEDEDGNLDIGKIAKRLGLDMLESSAGIVWFGDTVAKTVVDLVSAAKNGDKGTSDYYALNDNVFSTIDNIIKSTIKAVQKPTAVNIKNVALNMSVAAGVPLRNAYNILNSALLYGYDIASLLGVDSDISLGNYDDFLYGLQKFTSMSSNTRAKLTFNAALKSYRKGNTDKAEALLATIDLSDSKVVTSLKTEAKKAYISGKLSEENYRKFLSERLGLDADKVDDWVSKANKDIAVDALVSSNPKAYSGLDDAVKAAKSSAPEGQSKSEAVARAIIEAASEKEDIDTFVDKYTLKNYREAYSTASQYREPKDVIEILAAVDDNNDDRFARKEMWSYYQQNPDDEDVIRALWNAAFSTDFDEYKGKH